MSSTKMRLKWGRITGMAVLCAGAAFTATIMLNAAADQTPPTPTGLPACVNEDQAQPDCYWDASERGNGTGIDFAVVDGFVYRDPSNGTVPYCTPAIADRGGICWGEPYVDHSTNGGE